MHSVSDMMVHYIRDMQESKFDFLIEYLVLRRESIKRMVTQ